jgi:hypothetical protein
MTEFEWTMASLTAIGILFTSGGLLVGVTRGVEGIKHDMTQRVADEVLAREEAVEDSTKAFNEQIAKLRGELTSNQKTQYQEFGEAVLALRRFIESVEREMHKIEIWGRDNYVQKIDFVRAIDTMSSDVRSGFAGLKNDLGAIRLELKKEISQSAQGRTRPEKD